MERRTVARAQMVKSSWHWFKGPPICIPRRAVLLAVDRSLIANRGKLVIDDEQPSQES